MEAVHIYIRFNYLFVFIESEHIQAKMFCKFVRKFAWLQMLKIILTKVYMITTSKTRIVK